jgi:hypothetical protein
MVHGRRCSCPCHAHVQVDIKLARCNLPPHTIMRAPGMIQGALVAEQVRDRQLAGCWLPALTVVYDPLPDHPPPPRGAFRYWSMWLQRWPSTLQLSSSATLSQQPTRSSAARPRQAAQDQAAKLLPAVRVPVCALGHPRQLWRSCSAWAAAPQDLSHAQQQGLPAEAWRRQAAAPSACRATPSHCLLCGSSCSVAAPTRSDGPQQRSGMQSTCGASVPWRSRPSSAFAVLWGACMLAAGQRLLAFTSGWGP